MQTLQASITSNEHTYVIRWEPMAFRGAVNTVHDLPITDYDKASLVMNISHKQYGCDWVEPNDGFPSMM